MNHRKPLATLAARSAAIMGALAACLSNPPDFPSALASSPHPAHTGRPNPIPSPLPLSARPKQPESSKDAFPRASHGPHSPETAFNHATPYAGARRSSIG